jgi:hypothetical protein
MNATIKDQITTVEWNRREQTVTIVGLFGTKVVKEDNPVEIGLAVVEVMTGEPLAPPTSYRKCEEDPE